MQNKKHQLNELLTELLVIKDLYICGRMNQAICRAVVASGNRPSYSEDTWERYEALSESYTHDSIIELNDRRNEILENIEEFGPVSMHVVLNTNYRDFDEELINDMMRDAYGDVDSIAFASAYSSSADDFNALLEEYLV